MVDFSREVNTVSYIAFPMSRFFKIVSHTLVDTSSPLETLRNNLQGVETPELLLIRKYPCILPTLFRGNNNNSLDRKYECKNTMFLNLEISDRSEYIERAYERTIRKCVL